MKLSARADPPEGQRSIPRPHPLQHLRLIGAPGQQHDAASAGEGAEMEPALRPFYPTTTLGLSAGTVDGGDVLVTGRELISAGGCGEGFILPAEL